MIDEFEETLEKILTLISEESDEKLSTLKKGILSELERVEYSIYTNCENGDKKLKSEFNSLKTSVNLFAESVSEMQNHSDKNFANLKSETKSLNTKFDENQKDVKKILTYLEGKEELEKENENLKTSFELKNIEVSELQKQVSKLNVEKESLKKELAEQRSNFQDLSSDKIGLDQENKRLEQDLRDKESKIIELEKQVSKKIGFAENQQLEKENRELRYKVERLEDKFNSELESLRVEKSCLETKCRNLENGNVSNEEPPDHSDLHKGQQ